MQQLLFYVFILIFISSLFFTFSYLLHFGCVFVCMGEGVGLMRGERGQSKVVGHFFVFFFFLNIGNL